MPSVVIVIIGFIEPTSTPPFNYLLDHFSRKNKVYNYIMHLHHEADFIVNLGHVQIDMQLVNILILESI